MEMIDNICSNLCTTKTAGKDQALHALSNASNAIYIMLEIQIYVTKIKQMNKLLAHNNLSTQYY